MNSIGISEVASTIAGSLAEQLFDSAIQEEMKSISMPVELETRLRLELSFLHFCAAQSAIEIVLQSSEVSKALSFCTFAFFHQHLKGTGMDEEEFYRLFKNRKDLYSHTLASSEDLQEAVGNVGLTFSNLIFPKAAIPELAKYGVSTFLNRLYATRDFLNEILRDNELIDDVSEELNEDS
jgi:hypothetical protein